MSGNRHRGPLGPWVKHHLLLCVLSDRQTLNKARNHVSIVTIESTLFRQFKIVLEKVTIVKQVKTCQSIPRIEKYACQYGLIKSDTSVSNLTSCHTIQLNTWVLVIWQRGPLGPYVISSHKCNYNPNTAISRVVPFRQFEIVQKFPEFLERHRSTKF